MFEREGDQGRLDAVWTSDITYLATGEGAFPGLVDRTLRMAHTLRGTVPDDLVFHADRGTQYTSQMLFETCEELGIHQSMGRTGMCWDCQSVAADSRKDEEVPVGAV